jgi:hypothetical protein
VAYSRLQKKKKKNERAVIRIYYSKDKGICACTYLEGTYEETSKIVIGAFTYTALRNTIRFKKNTRSTQQLGYDIRLLGSKQGHVYVYMHTAYHMTDARRKPSELIAGHVQATRWMCELVHSELMHIHAHIILVTTQRSTSSGNVQIEEENKGHGIHETGTGQSKTTRLSQEQLGDSAYARHSNDQLLGCADRLPGCGERQPSCTDQLLGCSDRQRGRKPS